MPPRNPLRLVLSALLAPLLLLALPEAAPAQNNGPIPYSKLYPQARRAAPARTAAGARAVRPPPAPAAALPPTLDTVRLESYVDGLVSSAMADKHLAGAAVTVVQNGQVILKKGYGVDRLSPRRAVDPDRTLFRIGSISKTFTWIALQSEIEAGRMRLDAPVNLYLPERLQLKDQGFRSPVRLRDLMTHTPGFEEKVLGQLFERDWERVRPLTTYLRQESPRRVREPGQTVSYSNYGAALAGAALANVQGDTFERVIEKRILIPAGLTRTTFREPRPERPDLPQPMSDALAADVTRNFGWRDGAFLPRPFEYIGQVAPAGSASATPSDMGRYMTLLLGGGTIDGATVYSPAVDRALRTDLYRIAPQAAAWTGGLESLPRPGGRRGLGHQGATLSSSANLVLVPALNLGIFVAANSEGAMEFTRGLPSQVVRELYGPPAVPPPSSAQPADSSLFAGTYLTTRRAYVGLEAFVTRLIGRAQVEGRPNGRIVMAMDGQERAWLPAAQGGLFRAADGDSEPLAFRMGDNGRAQALVAPWGGITYERQGFFDSLMLMAILAGAAGICALATVGGLFLPLDAPTRQTMIQARTALSQTLQAVLWLISLICFAFWAAGSADLQRVAFDWPGGLIITASACALVAGALGGINLLLLPVVWRGGRRVDSWTVGRKLRFTATALIFVAFTALVGLWGGLTPWIS